MTPAFDGPLLSVIVPMGPSARGLPAWVLECLESGAIHAEVEVVVVRDGGLADPEPSSTPARVWPTWFREISLQPVGGAGAARNAGIASARGHFLAFADADDELDLEQLLYCVDQLHTSRADVGISGYFEDRGGVSSVLRHLVAQGPDSELESYLHDQAGIWRCVIRAEFLEATDIRFPILSFAEDVVFLLAVARAKPSVLPLPAVWYTYVVGVAGQLTSLPVGLPVIDSALRQIEPFATDRQSRALRKLARQWMARVAIRGVADQSGLFPRASVLGSVIGNTWRRRPGQVPVLISGIAMWPLRHAQRRRSRSRGTLGTSAT